MGQYNGDQNSVGFFYESGTYAQVSGALQWPGLITDNNVEEEPNRTAVRYTGTASRNVSKFVDVQKDVNGNFTYHPQDWKFLMFALGSIADGGSPSPYTHNIVESNGNEGNPFTSGTKTPFMSFGLEDSKTFGTNGLNFIRTVKGATVDEFSFNWSQGDIIEADVSYIAKEVSPYASGAKSALTEVTTRPFIPKDVSLQLPSGVPFATNEGTFTVSNNLNPRHYGGTGSQEIEVVRPENRDYTVEVNMDMESSEAKILYDQYFRGGSEFNAILSVDVSAGSRDMAATLSGCKITAMTVPTPAEGVNDYDITITPKSCSVLVNDSIELYGAW